MIGVGALLRGEGRAGRPRGVAAAAAMAEGRLVDDTLIFEVLTVRVAREMSRDARLEEQVMTRATRRWGAAEDGTTGDSDLPTL